MELTKPRDVTVTEAVVATYKIMASYFRNINEIPDGRHVLKLFRRWLKEPELVLPRDAINEKIREVKP